MKKYTKKSPNFQEAENFYEVKCTATHNLLSKFHMEKKNTSMKFKRKLGIPFDKWSEESTSSTRSHAFI